MTIEQIDSNRLLIILEDEEMQGYSLDFDRMELNDPNYKEILKQLLTIAGMRKDFEIRGKTLLVEALTHKSGCLFIVTVLPEYNSVIKRRYRIKKAKGTMIYGFSDVECLLSAIERLYKQGYAFENSKLYYNGEYHLVIYYGSGVPIRAIAILEEYGTKELAGKINLARIAEKSKLISGCHAILTIGTHLV